MKIYFTSSTAEFLKYKKYYFAIRKHLIESGHILTRDWLPRADYRVDTNQVEITGIKEIYKECMNAIAEADLVIVEDTVSNFSTGHQITVALQRQKPTLVLWSKPKHRHFKKNFIQGVDSNYLEFYEYNLKNFKDIINKFIKKYSQANKKNRFHLIINDVERNYLDWAQFNYGESRTKLIRKALRKLINEDNNYDNYLKR